jgi:hypothetical protein
MHATVFKSVHCTSRNPHPTAFNGYSMNSTRRGPLLPVLDAHVVCKFTHLLAHLHGSPLTVDGAQRRVGSSCCCCLSYVLRGFMAWRSAAVTDGPLNSIQRGVSPSVASGVCCTQIGCLWQFRTSSVVSVVGSPRCVVPLACLCVAACFSVRIPAMLCAILAFNGGPSNLIRFGALASAALGVCCTSTCCLWQFRTSSAASVVGSLRCVVQSVCVCVAACFLVCVLCAAAAVWRGVSVNSGPSNSIRRGVSSSAVSGVCCTSTDCLWQFRTSSAAAVAGSSCWVVSLFRLCVAACFLSCLFAAWIVPCAERCPLARRCLQLPIRPQLTCQLD